MHEDHSNEPQIRERLRAEFTALEVADQLGRESRKTVQLDQQSVGRLSRMDALQHQAMAKAEQTRREVARKRISAALVRLDEGEYGYCIDCGSPIEARRLELDPTVPTCVSCASG